MFKNFSFRLYTNTDVIGVETAGALKNICPEPRCPSWSQLRWQCQTAIITRGLAEITRLGVKLGASPLIYSGLSGVGDLIVTGTSVHSRQLARWWCSWSCEKLEGIEVTWELVIEHFHHQSLTNSHKNWVSICQLLKRSITYLWKP